MTDSRPEPTAPSSLGYRPLRPDEPFSFECVRHCWGTCCRHVNVRLDPLDVLDLARGLGCSTAEVLGSHVTLTIGGNGWPVATLRQAAEGPCAFLRPDGGCGVYEHRPTVCRTAPVGRALLRAAPGQPAGERLFFAKPHPRCAGCFPGAPEQTAEGWRRASGLGERYPEAEAYERLADWAAGSLGLAGWVSPQLIGLLVYLLFDGDGWQAELGLELDRAQALSRGRRAARELLLPVAAAFGRGPEAETTVAADGSLDAAALDAALAAGHGRALAALRGAAPDDPAG